MIALIDGDPLLYQAYWRVMMDYKKRIKANENEFNLGFISEAVYLDNLKEIERDHQTKGLNYAKANIRTLIENIVENTFSKDHAIAVGGPNNFRAALYEPYKNSSTRTTVRDNKPVWFDALKDYLCEQDGAVLTDGYEADDLLRIWAFECKAAGKEYVICSIDKDLDCIAGNHYINIHPTKSNTFYTVTEKYADRFYWKQILMGDSIDNIPGIKGCGPKTADKILDAEGPGDYETRVCRAYHKAYGDDGYEHLILNGRLIHIWRHMDDHFKISRETYDGYILSV